jgi:hypothetical protein
MPNRTDPEFVIVTDKNLKEVAHKLESGSGIVVIADPEHWTSDPELMTGKFELHLFDRPTIDLRKLWLKVPRGTKTVGSEQHQTGWENDRKYRLYPKEQPTEDQDDGISEQLAQLYRRPSPKVMRRLNKQVDELFEQLHVGEYVFTIGLQSSSGHTLERNQYSHWQVYYIPRTVSPRAGLIHALTWMTDQWNTQKPPEGWKKQFKFCSQHIRSIVRYMLRDLETGSVLKHNIDAGRMADTLTGLA